MRVLALITVQFPLHIYQELIDRLPRLPGSSKEALRNLDFADLGLSKAIHIIYLTLLPDGSFPVIAMQDDMKKIKDTRNLLARYNRSMADSKRAIDEMAEALDRMNETRAEAEEAAERLRGLGIEDATVEWPKELDEGLVIHKEVRSIPEKKDARK